MAGGWLPISAITLSIALLQKLFVEGIVSVCDLGPQCVTLALSASVSIWRINVHGSHYHHRSDKSWDVFQAL
jgi:hypothetical protein